MKLTTLTFTRISFNNAISDVASLLSIHDTKTGRRRAVPSPGLEVLKRSGVILSITAWESFIEDTIEAAAYACIRDASSPTDVRRAFNTTAHEWMRKVPAPQPPDLADWTGEGWRDLLRQAVRREIAALHSPTSANVRELSRRYLARDLTECWHWKGMSAKQACARLDALISLRGKLVHRTKKFPDRRASVKRQQLVDAMALLRNLVQCTELALGCAPKEQDIPDEEL